ncbi:CBS domain-containing protein [Maribacter litopenaei]|uniref:CBS domain-containing protein n=1 Tax=Maribacter litopenaei TaxID=2976127 RepID=A0ABY5Y633_9FLAO|nr:CBS domain-containing protein [Maribacter litopenaei]UWX54473.1 CBS domain-containing protein [Maribacter litopenaei]
MDFQDAKDNFIKAARNGAASIMLWKGTEIPIRDLIIKELLPLAYEGLKKCTINPNDIHRYLEVIEKRAKGNSGSRWSVLSYRQLKKNMKQDDAVIALTEAIYENQQTLDPVSNWPIIPKRFKVRSSAGLAKHIMSTQLLTVNENDMADMATTIMNWKNIHHVPVLNDENELCGLLTWSHMTEYLKERSDFTTAKVGDLMVKEVISVAPETDLETVYELLEKNHIGCVPVVNKSSLVGIITLKDMTEI